MVVTDHKGRKFRNVRAMAAWYGIPYHCLLRRLHHLPVELALTLPYKYGTLARDHTGKEYKSIADMARAWGKRPSSVRLRLDRGWTVEEALTIGNAKKDGRYHHHWREKYGNDDSHGPAKNS